MYEEWFEKIAKTKGIEKVNQTKTHIELILTIEKTKKIVANELFMKATSISKMFRLSFKQHRMRIILDIVKIDKHWLYYIVELISKM
jgi:transcription-repair coupling factor (superfamily II helicase)